MDIQAITQLFVVKDIERSKKFYSEVLGAEVYREYGGTSLVLKLNDVWLLLVTGGGPTPDKPTVDFVTPENPDRISKQMIFRVKDANQTYERFKAKGAVFLTPPVKNGIETRAFFRDPDGHLMEISSLEE